MALLSKEAILAAQDVRFVEVEVPEWGGTVRVKAMSAKERDAWEIACMGDLGGIDPRDKQLLNRIKAGIENVRARLLAFTVVDEAGALMFSDADIEALGKKSAAAVNRVYEAATRLNAIGEDEVKALAKN